MIRLLMRNPANINKPLYVLGNQKLNCVICDGETTGMVRIRVEEKSDRILGATIVGKGAGNMISEITLAIQSNTGLGALAAVIRPYPTNAEAIRQAGDLYNRTKLTPTTKSLLRGLVKVQR